MKKEIELLKKELEGIVDASNDNIVVADGDGTVLRASANSQAIYGKDPSYLIGETVYQLEKESVFNPSVSVRALREKKEVQIMQTTPQGLVVMATGIPIYDTENNIIRVISFSHDLTEIQQLKEDYEHLQTKMKRYESEIEELRGKELEVNGTVIKSEGMQRVWNLIQRMAKSDATVVLLGESGVGKNVFARMLHNHSKRYNDAFIEVNCGAIPVSLFEAELFGYEHGAFTGASKKGKVGMIELAHQGTLFLDEIAEIPLDLQVKLLKVLEEKKITRVGGTNTVDVDFRLIAATNQNLEEKVKEGSFREDLYYRLHVVPVTIPPLRDRKEDIYHLVYYYLSMLNQKYESNVTFHASTIEVFQQYEWPGNVRQLENLMERLVVTADSTMIYPSHLPLEMSEHANLSSDSEAWALATFDKQGLTLQEALQEVEKRWLKRAYRQYKTTYEMAEYLGVSQATVVRRLKKYNINSK